MCSFYTTISNCKAKIRVWILVSSSLSFFFFFFLNNSSSPGPPYLVNFLLALIPIYWFLFPSGKFRNLHPLWQHEPSISRTAPRREGKSPITGRPWTQSAVLLVKTPMGRFTNWPSCSVQSPPKPTGSRVKVLVIQSCLTLCNPMDCSPPGSSLHGIPRQEYWSGLPFPTAGGLPRLC